MRSIVVEAYPSVMKSSRALPSIRFPVCRARSARVGLEVLTGCHGCEFTRCVTSCSFSECLRVEVSRMAVITNSVVLRCSPQVVFDYLSDHRSELEWNPKCRSMEKLTEGPVGVGTGIGRSGPAARSWSWRPWRSTGRAPGRCTTAARSKSPSPAAWNLSTEGTRLHASFEPTPHGWFRLVFPLFLVMMRRDEKTNMAHLRDAVERHAGARRRVETIGP
jgi:hypothetical protein